MEKPVQNAYQNERGFFKLRYPSVLQIVFISAIWLFLILFSVIFQTNFRINPQILTYLSIGYAIIAAIITIMVFRNPAGAERKFITSTENLRGFFQYEKLWALYIGFYFAAFTIATVINGYFLIALPCFIILILDIIAAKVIKKGIRIDDAGNMYFVARNNETFIDFSRASEVEFTYDRLAIKFNTDVSSDLPLKLVIRTAKLKSVEYSSHLDQQVLGNFVKEKCEKLGFNIKETRSDYINEWIAEK